MRLESGPRNVLLLVGKQAVGRSRGEMGTGEKAVTETQGNLGHGQGGSCEGQLGPATPPPLYKTPHFSLDIKATSPPLPRPVGNSGFPPDSFTGPWKLPGHDRAGIPARQGLRGWAGPFSPLAPLARPGEWQ